MGYRIVKRVRTNYVDSTGVATDGYRVYFLMDDGTPDYVEVPKASYNNTTVKAAIEETIEAHKDVTG